MEKCWRHRNGYRRRLIIITATSSLLLYYLLVFCLRVFLCDLKQISLIILFKVVKGKASVTKCLVCNDDCTLHIVYMLWRESAHKNKRKISLRIAGCLSSLNRNYLLMIENNPIINFSFPIGNVEFLAVSRNPAIFQF